MRVRPSPGAFVGVAQAVPWALSALLGVVYAPGLLRSPLLQGDLPGHLEAMRWFARFIWPLPWGWDPRYLLGAPVGVLYPPLFHWLGGALGQVVPVEWGLRWLLLLAIVALPPAFARAARGMGLRRDEAGFAAAAALCVLWLPQPGLGGSLRQTLVAGNAANGFALPLFALFVARLRRAVGRPARDPWTAALLALIVLSHFLVGAVTS